MTGAGCFISFEGIDRSGKSTQAALLADLLGQRALLVREPGGTVFSESVRGVLKDPSVPLSPRAEALLFAAARADLTERVIAPSIAAGKIVIADRFIDSSLAYQGAARGLGIDEIERISRWAACDLMPDLTLMIEVDPQVAAARGAEENDRFEDEGVVFQSTVAAAYSDLALRYPDRIVRIDGERDPVAVSEDALRVVRERLQIQLP